MSPRDNCSRPLPSNSDVEVRREIPLKAMLKIISIINGHSTPDRFQKNILSSLEFFNALMSTLQLFDVENESEVYYMSWKKKLRAILHILHHLYISSPLSTVPREFEQDEVYRLLWLSLSSISNYDRIRGRAQVCCRHFFSPTIINITFSDYFPLSRCLTLFFEGLIDMVHGSSRDFSYIYWLMKIVSEYVLDQSIFLPLKRIFSSSRCQKIVDALRFLINWLTFQNHENFFYAQNRIYEILRLYLVLENPPTEALRLSLKIILNLYSPSFQPNIIEIINCSIVNSNNDIPSLYLLGLLFLKPVKLERGMIFKFLPSIITYFKCIKLLSLTSLNRAFLYSLLRILKYVRNYSLDFFRQLWKNQLLDFILTSYDASNIIPTIDLLCPLFQFVGGVDWIFSFSDKLSNLINDLVDLSLHSTVGLSGDVSSSILIFFRLGATKSHRWISFCNQVSYGRVVSCIAFEIYKKSQFKDLSVLSSYCDTENLILFTLWPIGATLWSSTNGLFCNTKAELFITKLEQLFGQSIGTTKFPELLYQQFPLKAKPHILLLFLISRYYENTKIRYCKIWSLDGKNIINYTFIGSFWENCQFFQFFPCSIKHEIFNLVIEKYPLARFLQALYDEPQVLSIEEFIDLIPSSMCKLCFLISLIETCSFLQMSTSINFFLKVLQVVLTTAVMRYHSISICAMHFFKLFYLQPEFDYLLSLILQGLGLDDIEPLVPFIYSHYVNKL